MAVLEYLAAEKVMVLCHKMFLESLFKDSGDSRADLFDLRVPFMMDLEAEKVAMAMEGKQVKQKKKRGPERNYPFPRELEYLEKKFNSAAAPLQSKYFPGQPSAQDFKKKTNKRGGEGFREDLT